MHLANEAVMVNRDKRRHFWLGIWGGCFIGMFAHYASAHEWAMAVIHLLVAVGICVVEVATSHDPVSRAGDA